MLLNILVVNKFRSACVQETRRMSYIQVFVCFYNFYLHIGLEFSHSVLGRVLTFSLLLSLVITASASASVSPPPTLNTRRDNHYCFCIIIITLHKQFTTIIKLLLLLLFFLKLSHSLSLSLLTHSQISVPQIHGFPLQTLERALGFQSFSLSL